MNKLELLSPAGDIDIFKSVVNAGADAVYFGGDLFGARAYAKNFTIEEAKEAISYAHFHGAKAYLTVNTLLKNLEIEKDLYTYLKAYVENGIDAFIVQDFGVMEFIKNYFPTTPIHASTQQSICSKEGARLLENFGASRIVTAREISSNEIAAIHKECPELEIESFIHGALCVCYSGQCLMSSIIGGRSGNRGRCAQPCRLPYKAIDNSGSPLTLPGDYILSPKDFCTVEHLPEMIKAGVMSFKIEGRMKQLSYATGVVSVYRHYIDEYLYKGEKGYKVSEKDIKKLLDYGNRSGFTDLYITKHNGPEMVTFVEPSHSKSENQEGPAKERKVKLYCKVKAFLGEALTITFTDEMDNSYTATGPVIEAAKSKGATEEDIIKSVSALGSTDFELRKIDVDFDENCFIPVSWLKGTRREAIEGLYKCYISEVSPIINDFNELIYKRNENCTDANSVFVSVDTIAQLKVVKDFDFVSQIAVPIELYQEAKEIKELNAKIAVSLPTVLREEHVNSINIPADTDILVKSYDGLGLVKKLGINSSKIILDHRMYTFSNRAIDAFDKEFGYGRDCIPLELSLKEIAHRNNRKSQMIIYSRIPLMVTANCTVKNSLGCKKNNDEFKIIDRKSMKMPVKCNCTYCYNTIYNSKKYCAFDLKDELIRTGAKEFRIDFSLENEAEIREILNAYQSVFINDKAFRANEEYTKAHLKRGVE